MSDHIGRHIAGRAATAVALAPFVAPPRRAAPPADEEEPFEIEDFSLATPWERAAAAAERHILEWATTQSVSLELPPLVYRLSCHGPRPDSAQLAVADGLAGNPASRLIPDKLVRWFGFSSFVVLEPTSRSALNASEMALAQGLLNIALSAAQCSAPGFVVHDCAQGALCGRALSRRSSWRYDVGCFSPVPLHLRQLLDCVDVFRERLRAGMCLAGEARVRATVRLTYLLTRWPAWQPIRIGSGAFSLRVGKSDPHDALALGCEWRFPEGEVREMEASARAPSLAPQAAAVWRLRALDNTELVPSTCTLARAARWLLDGLTQAADAAETLRVASDGGCCVTVDALLSTCGSSPLSDVELLETLRIILQRDDESGGGVDGGDGPLPTQSAPSGSLMMRLGAATLCVAGAGADDAGGSARRCRRATMAALSLWRGVLSEAHRAWEHGSDLHHLPRRAPITGGARSHQQLSLVSCCLEKRRQLVADGESVESFVECEESEVVEGSDKIGIGRAQPLEGEVGLESGLLLWVPVTQEEPPMTRDALEARDDALIDAERHGAQAAQVRARLQSALLKSDMQAFKAANPGCCLADFVRWHSPRDWIVADDGSSGPESRGELSQRMREPGNLWAALWASTLPVAATQQRPLFDPVREAQVALFALESMDAHALLSEIVLCALEHLLSSLAAAEYADTCGIADEAAELHRQAPSVCACPGGEDADAWCVTVGRLEQRLSQVASLVAKLSESPRLVSSMYANPGGEVELDESERSALGEQLLSRVAAERIVASKAPAAETCEFVLQCDAHRSRRTDAGRSAAASQGHHQMFVGVHANQARVAMALEEAV